MQLSVIFILTDESNKTIGAEVRFDGENDIKTASTDWLKANRHNIVCTNAIIDCNGFVKSKAGGTLPKKLYCTSLKVYHGSKEPNLIPAFGKGATDTDFGQGFYTTPNLELAREWAWSGYTTGEKGFVYSYEIPIENLKVLDFRGLPVENWVAELLKHRSKNIRNRLAFKDSIELFIEKYSIKTDNYDIIIGYRADDSYFNYINDFVYNAIYLDTLLDAMRLGDLGIQIVIKSKLAFSLLKKIKRESVPRATYERKYKTRVSNASNRYISLAQKEYKNKVTFQQLLNK